MAEIKEMECWAAALDELVKRIPGYDEKLGLVRQWNGTEWRDKYGQPGTDDECREIWKFWRRFGFPEGLVVAVRRTGVGSGREARPPRGMEEKEDQAWTKQNKYFRVSKCF